MCPGTMHRGWCSIKQPGAQIQGTHLRQPAAAVGVAVTAAPGVVGAFAEEAQSLASLLHVSCVFLAVMSSDAGRAQLQQQGLLVEHMLRSLRWMLGAGSINVLDASGDLRI